MKSIFEQANEKTYPALENNVNAEIAVVGGGVAGILTAYHLTQQGHKVVLLEARRICSGTTSKSTATITALQGLFYNETANRYSLEVAAEYLSAQADAITMYKDIINKNNIDCDFQTMPAYLFSLGGKEKEIKKEYNTLQKLGAEVSLENNSELPFKTGKMLKLENQAQINILKFLYALPKNFEIFENSRVIDVDLNKKVLRIENGKTVTAQKIIFATKFPIIDDGLHFLKMYQTKSYVVTFKYPNLNGFYVDIAENGLYIRSYNGNIVLGGFDHRTGREKNKDTYKRLENCAKHYFYADETDLQWSADDSVTFDNIPFVGALSKKHSDIYVITGFNEWGIANAMITSKLVCNLICKEPDKYKSLFAPRRRYLRNTLSLFFRNFGSIFTGLTTGLLRLPLCSAKSTKRGEAKIARLNGKRVAAYRDEDGKLYTFKSTCSHLHCGLKFNYTDKLWECPCHGSRYDLSGNIIDGPAVEPITIEKPARKK